MGLDAVELVMEVEDHFGISLPDRDAERVQTVGDLVALVLSKLPTAAGACPTARAFHVLRRALLTDGRIRREEIRPDAELANLFVSGRGRRWFRLARVDHRIPRLELTVAGRAALWFQVIGTAALCVGVGMMMHRSAGDAGATVGEALFVLIPGMVGLGWVSVVSRSRLPAGVVTVGDLARRIAPKLELGDLPADDREERVTRDVRMLVAEQMDIPIETVRLESHLIHDLGMG